MKLWRVRFRYIPQSDYCTPLTYIPIETTFIEAETEEKAWEKFCSGGTDPSDYHKEDIYLEREVAQDATL